MRGERHAPKAATKVAGAKPAYQVVWPKRGCWATMKNGGAVRGFATFRLGLATNFGSVAVTGADSLVFGLETSTSAGSWANASRTRAFGEISGFAVGAAVATGWTIGAAVRATFAAATTGIGADETVEFVSNTTRSGSFLSVCIRTGGKSVPDVSVLGSGIWGSTALDIKINESKVPPT